MLPSQLKNEQTLGHQEKQFLESLVKVYSKGNDQEKINAVIRGVAAKIFFHI